MTQYKKSFQYDKGLTAEKITSIYDYIINDEYTAAVVDLGEGYLFAMGTEEIPQQLPIVEVKLSYTLGDKIIVNGKEKTVRCILIRHESDNQALIIYSSSDDVTENLESMALYEIDEEFVNVKKITI